MTQELLPQPAPHAKTITSAIEFVLSGIPYFGSAFRMMLELRMKEGQNILLESVENYGLSTLTELSDAQEDFFVPACYRFFEQVRLGEYKHNLKVIGKILSEELFEHEQTGDIGRVARAARHLEMISISSLDAIAVIQTKISSTEIPNAHGGFLSTHLLDWLSDGESETGRQKSQAIIQDLLWRGIIQEEVVAFASGNALFYKTTAIFFDVIDAVESTISEFRPPNRC